MEMKWGLIPDMSITRTLPRLVRIDVAKELTYTGRVLSASEALQLGLVTWVKATRSRLRAPSLRDRLPLPGRRARREASLRGVVDAPARGDAGARGRASAWPYRLTEPARRRHRRVHERAGGVRGSVGAAAVPSRGRSCCRRSIHVAPSPGVGLAVTIRAEQGQNETPAARLTRRSAPPSSARSADPLRGSPAAVTPGSGPGDEGSSPSPAA